MLLRLPAQVWDSSVPCGRYGARIDPGTGWRSAPGVMERVYNRARPGEFAQELRGELDRARATLSVGEFAPDLELGASSGDERVAGLARS